MPTVILSAVLALAGCGGGGFAGADPLQADLPIPPEVATAGPVRLSFAFSPADVVGQQGDASLPDAGDATYTKTFAADAFTGPGARFNNATATMNAFFKKTSREITGGGSTFTIPALGFSDIIISFSNGVRVIMTNEAAGDNANSFVGRLYEFLPLAGGGGKYLKAMGRATGFVSGGNFEIALDFSPPPPPPITCPDGSTATTLAECPPPPMPRAATTIVQSQVATIPTTITRNVNNDRTYTLTKTGGAEWTTPAVAVSDEVQSYVTPDFFAVNWSDLNILEDNDYLVFGIWYDGDGSRPDAGGFAIGASLRDGYQFLSRGTATYSGKSVYALNSGNGFSLSGGDVSFTATFGSRNTTVSGTLTTTGLGVYNFGEATIGGDNSLSGSFTCQSCASSAEGNSWKGAFYGNVPSGVAPPKLGGTFAGEFIIGSTNIKLIGGFGAELQ